MKRFLMIIYFAFCFTSIATNVVRLTQADKDVKHAPEHVGVGTEFTAIVSNYMADAAKHNIKFTHQVTVGMTKIKDERADDKKTIGLCSFGPGWREIDIDSDFWKHASAKRRKILLYHELTHCYCGRDHDYEDGKPYLGDKIERILASLQNRPFYVRKPGYYLDQCPLSIMHPQILEEECISDHYDDYMEEMWNRCKPY